jgi:hypothetical protein
MDKYRYEILSSDSVCNSGADPDMHPFGKSDSDPHQTEKIDPDPHQS